MGHQSTMSPVPTAANRLKHTDERPVRARVAGACYEGSFAAHGADQSGHLQLGERAPHSDATHAEPRDQV
jgi:hypothetical protein